MTHQPASRTTFGDETCQPPDDPSRGITERSLPPVTPEMLRTPGGAWLDLGSWFEHPERRFEIEVGSGKGTFLVQQAPVQPETNFLGIEYAGEFFRHAADRVARNRLGNVRMLYADATSFLAVRCPSDIAQVVHLYFPDPWPKTRHHKRRSLNDTFLRTVHRILVPGGELRIATDHEEYWEWMEEHFARWCAPGHEPRYERGAFVSPESAGEGEVVGTNFERKYRREGRTFHAVTLTAIKDRHEKREEER